MKRVSGTEVKSQYEDARKKTDIRGMTDNSIGLFRHLDLLMRGLEVKEANPVHRWGQASDIAVGGGGIFRN